MAAAVAAIRNPLPAKLTGTKQTVAGYEERLGTTGLQVPLGGRAWTGGPGMSGRLRHGRAGRA